MNRFEIVQSGPKAKVRKYWWRLVCEENGEILFLTQRYTRRADARRSMLRALSIIHNQDYELPA